MSGECEDFADFLVCLSNAVTSSNMKAQRTNSLNGPGFKFKPVVTCGIGTRIQSFTYHEFAILGFNVWDGCITITGIGIPEGCSPFNHKVQLIYSKQANPLIEFRIMDYIFGKWV